jgi:choline kinase
MTKFYNADEAIIHLRKTTTSNATEGIVSIATECVQARAIELGLGFVISHNDTVASEASDYMLLRTPATGLITVAFISILAVDGKEVKASYGRIRLYEDAVVSADGTDTGVIISNYNRNSTTTPAFVVKGRPTVTTEGTVLAESLLAEQLFKHDTTWQLKADTDYLIEVYNDGTVGFDYSVILNVFQIPA